MYVFLQGYASGFQDLIVFLNSLKESLYVILFGTSSHIFVPRYLTDCKAIMSSFNVFSPKVITR